MTNERIHAYLDGDLPLEALTPEERFHAARLEEALGAAAARLRAQAPPGLAARVMASLPAAPDPVAAPAVAPLPAATAADRGEPAWKAALGWLWTPRPVRLTFRPAYAFAGAALALVVGTQLPRLGADSERGPVAAPPVTVRQPAAGPPPVFVQFRLEAEGATSVRLAGTFTGWKPEVTLTETAPGEWSALVPLHPGVHDYAFVIDGERWVADPHAPQIDDDFGGTNSRISLPPPGSQT